RGTVAAPSHVPGRGERGRLGDPDQIHREIPFHREPSGAEQALHQRVCLRDEDTLLARVTLVVAALHRTILLLVAGHVHRERLGIRRAGPLPPGPPMVRPHHHPPLAPTRPPSLHPPAPHPPPPPPPA